jgi:hypothetical protein
MSDTSEDAMRAEIAALRALVVRNLRDEILSSSDPEAQTGRIRIDLLEVISRLYRNQEDREKQAAINAKALEIIDEAIAAMSRSRSSTRPS